MRTQKTTCVVVEWCFYSQPMCRKMKNKMIRLLLSTVDMKIVTLVDVRSSPGRSREACLLRIRGIRYIHFTLGKGNLK